MKDATNLYIINKLEAAARVLFARFCSSMPCGVYTLAEMADAKKKHDGQPMGVYFDRFLSNAEKMAEAVKAADLEGVEVADTQIIIKKDSFRCAFPVAMVFTILHRFAKIERAKIAPFIVEQPASNTETKNDEKTTEKQHNNNETITTNNTPENMKRNTNTRNTETANTLVINDELKAEIFRYVADRLEQDADTWNTSANQSATIPGFKLLGFLIPYTRAAFAARYGEEITAAAESAHFEAKKAAADAFAASHYMQHAAEADAHQAAGAPAPSVGSFVWGLGGIGKYSDFGQIVEEQTKAREEGHEKKPRLVYIEKVVNMTDADALALGANLMADLPDAFEGFEGGDRSDDMTQEESAQRHDWSTWYTIAAAVVTPSGRWFAIDPEGYSYARFAFLPTNYAQTWPETVALFEKSLDARRAAEAVEKMAEAKAAKIKEQETAAAIEKFSKVCKKVEKMTKEYYKTRTRNLRAALALVFPGVKFSVSMSRGSMCSNYGRIDWTNGPSREEVEEVAQWFEYDARDYDPYADYDHYTYYDTPFTDAFGGFDSLWLNRTEVPGAPANMPTVTEKASTGEAVKADADTEKATEKAAAIDEGEARQAIADALNAGTIEAATVGEVVEITGNTYRLRRQFRALGAKWNKARQLWEVPAAAIYPDAVPAASEVVEVEDVEEVETIDAAPAAVILSAPVAAPVALLPAPVASFEVSPAEEITPAEVVTMAEEITPSDTAAPDDLDCALAAALAKVEEIRAAIAERDEKRRQEAEAAARRARIEEARQKAAAAAQIAAEAADRAARLRQELEQATRDAAAAENAAIVAAHELAALESEGASQGTTPDQKAVYYTSAAGVPSVLLPGMYFEDHGYARRRATLWRFMGVSDRCAHCLKVDPMTGDCSNILGVKDDGLTLFAECLEVGKYKPLTTAPAAAPDVAAAA